MSTPISAVSGHRRASTWRSQEGLSVVYLIDSLVPGGAEISLFSMLPHLSSKNVKLEVACLHDRPGIKADLERAGTTVVSLSGGGGRAGWLRRALAYLRGRRPDLVHTTLFEADLIGRLAAGLARIPVVSSLVNVAYGPEHTKQSGLRLQRVLGARLADAATSRLVVRFHAISRHVAEVMSRRLWIPLERVDVVPRGRDPELLGTRTNSRRARARDVLGIGGDKPMVLAAARHERQKGLDILIESFPQVLRHLPDAQLLIAGREGNQTAALHSSVHRLGMDDVVCFMGARSDLPDLLCAADAFVLSSRWEGLGGVLLEAMALEAPIVATNLPAVAEVVADGVHARLVPPGSPEALAYSILEVLTDPADAAERARRARSRFIESFTVSKVTDQMVTFYERALGGRKAAWTAH
jgi:glycosyltransferase involved in cell wall biosynthesis